MIKRTNSENTDFLPLIKYLDQNLAEKNGDKNDFFKQFNKVDFINNVVVIYENETAVACGAFKQYDEKTIEIKRMFTCQEHRKKGYAKTILCELIKWAEEEKFEIAILETGKQMTEAISLYERFGFKTISNYPPYENEPTSICFKKIIN